MIFEAVQDAETGKRKFLQRREAAHSAKTPRAALAVGLAMWAALLYVSCPAQLHFASAPIVAEK